MRASVRERELGAHLLELLPLAQRRAPHGRVGAHVVVGTQVDEVLELERALPLAVVTQVVPARGGEKR